MEIKLIVPPIYEQQINQFWGSLEYKRGKRIHRLDFPMGEVPKYFLNDEQKSIDTMPESIKLGFIKQAKALGWI